MSSTTAILRQLQSAKTALPENIAAIKQLAAPVAEIGVETLAHLGIGALSAVSGLPLQKIGMFAAPALGKLAGAATELALDGVEKVGAAALGGAINLLEPETKKLARENAPSAPTPFNLRPITARAA